MRNSSLSILALLAVAATAGMLWFTSAPKAPGKATWDDVRAEAKQGGYRLISTQALWQRYRDEKDRLLLVDTRQEWEFRSGHIKGAVNFPMTPTWYARWRKKGELGRFLGEDKSRAIVFY